MRVWEVQTPTESVAHIGNIDFDKQAPVVPAPQRQHGAEDSNGSLRANDNKNKVSEPQLEVHFRAFRAIDEPETCAAYTAGHQQVLRDYGIENITSNNNVWSENPNIYCVVAETIGPDGRELVGGIRIQQADGVYPLPVAEAVGHRDPGIHEIIASYMDEGVGELCALWNSKKVARRGISVLLVRACISIINQVGFRTLVGICAEYTLNMFQRVGFVVNNNLGDEGMFAYPNDSYIARVLGILDARTLDTANQLDKDRMQSLRMAPKQNCIEESKFGQLKANYNLHLPQSTGLS